MVITNNPAGNPLQNLSAVQRAAAVRPAAPALSTGDKVRLESGVPTGQDTFTNTGAARYSLAASQAVTASAPPAAAPAAQSDGASPLVTELTSIAKHETTDTAVWSAVTAAPSTDLAGSSITVNGVTLQFVDSSRPAIGGGTGGGTGEPVTPDDPNIGNSGSDDPSLGGPASPDDDDDGGFPATPDVPDIGSSGSEEPSLGGFPATPDVPNIGGSGSEEPSLGGFPATPDDPNIGGSGSEEPSLGGPSTEEPFGPAAPDDDDNGGQGVGGEPGTGGVSGSEPATPATPGASDDSGAIQVDLAGLTSAEAVAAKFLETVRGDAVQAAMKDFWQLSDDAAAAFDASWAQGADGAWTLSFRQSETLRKPNTDFDVTWHTAEAPFITTPVTPPGPSSALRAAYEISLGGYDLRDGFGLQIGDTLYTVVTDAARAGTYTRDADGAAGMIYISDSDNDFEVWNSLQDVFADLFPQLPGGYFHADIDPSSFSSTEGFQVTLYSEYDYESGAAAPIPDFAVVKPHVELVQDVTADVMTEDPHPASLEYQIDLDAMTNGDSFTFRGVQFVLDSTAAAQTSVGASGTVITVNADAPESDDAGAPVLTQKQQLLTNLASAFNTYFGPRTVTPVAPGSSSGGSGWSANVSSDRPVASANPFRDLLSMLKAGAFEMRVTFNGSIATVSIRALSDRVLNDAREIGVEEDEVWEDGEPAEAPAEEPAPEEPVPDAAAADPAQQGDPEGVPAAAPAVPAAPSSAMRAAPSSAASAPASTAPSASTGAPSAAAGTAPANPDAADDPDADPEQAQQAPEDAREKVADDPAQIAKAQAENLQTSAVQQLAQN